MPIFKIIGLFVFLYPLFMSIVWMIGGIVFHYRRERKPLTIDGSLPPFSIIVPGHNEEFVIEKTLIALKHLNYPDYEVIVVNDGSTDGTGVILDRFADENRDWLRVIHLTPNSGKSRALNAAILAARHEFVLTIDADCLVDRDVLNWMALHLMKFPRVGAVTGNPRVLNRTSLLAKVQVGEFSSIIGLIKRTQRILGKVLTVSGVIAAYRKSAIFECGLFDSDTVTEDIDITWKLQRRFWDIRYEPKALCWILVPETMRGLWAQRVRWAQGGVEVLVKHRDIWLDYRHRRLIPVYIESVSGLLWSHVFMAIVALWLLFRLGVAVNRVYPHRFFEMAVSSPIGGMITGWNPLYPQWHGTILGVVCLLTFLTSFLLDYRYDDRKFIRYYFYVIWYPVAYWILSSLAAIKGTFNILFRRKGITARWKSPDRGLQTLRHSSAKNTDPP